jgi:hypothetical protein
MRIPCIFGKYAYGDRLGPAGRQPVLLLRLRGGLGNQLFQYAAGRALALRNGVPLRLDRTSGFRSDPYGRSYDLGGFNVLDEGTEPVFSADLGIRAALFREFVKRREVWRMQAGQYFDQAIYNLRIKRPTVLDAYCQSHRYFREIEDLVRMDLEFKTAPPGLSDVTAGEIMQGNSVCMHVRRLHGKEADGSRPQSVADYFGACDIAYYRRAIREIASVHGSLRLFVFSDDIGWAQQNAGLFETEGCSVTVIDEDPLQSFYLMRLCRHFIIANSTFSWWAAWLGGHAMKTVCVPSVWNRGERHFPRDLFPPGWKVVPAAPTPPSACPAVADPSEAARTTHETPAERGR